MEQQQPASASVTWSASPGKVLMTLAEVAEMTRLSENTIRWLRHNQAFPEAGKLGRRLFWRREQIESWINAQFDKDGQASA